MGLREDADLIMKEALRAAMPDEAVRKALSDFRMPSGRLILVAIGKASWQMAHAASCQLGDSVSDGMVITKYGHSKGNIPHLEICEAGHPVPDGNSFMATGRAIGKVKDLSENDTVLFLISGGGSALFEKPLCDGKTLESVTGQLLKSGADIVEINTIRKRLSAVKGGRFAELCRPAHVFSIVLSDIIGDPLDMIASGPACPDSSTSADALRIVNKYGIEMPSDALDLLEKETPKKLSNVETRITGSVKQLCIAAERKARELGYEPHILTDSLTTEAQEAGRWLSSIAGEHRGTNRSLCFIAGGETVVHVTGKGLGGRNQELALSAAEGIRGMDGTCVFSLGSDGTDGPTDAAGGYVDFLTADKLERLGTGIPEVLRENDSYHALEKVDGLIMTGPTGTNVNDVSILLIKR